MAEMQVRKGAENRNDRKRFLPAQAMLQKEGLKLDRVIILMSHFFFEKDLAAMLPQQSQKLSIGMYRAQRCRKIFFGAGEQRFDNASSRPQDDEDIRDVGVTNLFIGPRVDRPRHRKLYVRGYDGFNALSSMLRMRIPRSFLGFEIFVELSFQFPRIGIVAFPGVSRRPDRLLAIGFG